MIFVLRTFGCKSNQYESQGLRELLLQAGHEETDDPAYAQALVVNTCGVTGRAGASCRSAIRRALRANPSLRLVVTGCGVDLGERWPEFPGPPPILVPNAKKHAIADLIRADGREEAAARPADRFGLEISRFHGHTRAFLKIQDGCDNFCAYCAVPRARGLPESRHPDAAAAEAARLVRNGHAELVLTGINIGAYNHGGLDLAGLVERLAAVPGLARLRLGSVEPPYLTERLVEAMARHPVVCPHVHLPLQSGDDGVLRAMRRRYSVAGFLEKIDLLRTRLDRPAVSTDIIVGFPGEDGRAAERSEEVCRGAGFSRLHVFLFSARPGTPAAAMEQTSGPGEREARKARLLRAGKELARDYAERCVGLEERVVVEDSGAGLSDRYVRVNMASRHPRGALVRVRITAARDGEVTGETV